MNTTNQPDKELIAIGFRYRSGDDTYTMSLSEHFHLEVDDNTPFIVANEEESLTQIIYTEFTQEIVDKVNATMELLNERKPKKQ